MTDSHEELWHSYDLQIRKLRIQADGYRWLFENSADHFRWYDNIIHGVAILLGPLIGLITFSLAANTNSVIRSILSGLTVLTGIVSGFIRYLNYPQRIAQLSSNAYNISNLLNDIDRQMAMPATRREDPVHFNLLILANFRQITTDHDQLDIPARVISGFIKAHPKQPRDELPSVVTRKMSPEVIARTPQTAGDPRETIRRSGTDNIFARPNAPHSPMQDDLEQCLRECQPHLPTCHEDTRRSSMIHFPYNIQLELRRMKQTTGKT